MNTNKKTSLQIVRVYATDPARLFDAWSNPDVMGRWLHPFGEAGSAVVENTFEVGGGYKIVMYSPDGEAYTHTGVYREIVPNEKIVFTWDSSEVKDTVVTLEFNQVSDGTELILTHELFPDVAAVNRHREGWEGCLANLSNQLTTNT